MTKDIQILLVEDSSADAEMTIDALKSSGLSDKLLHLRDGAIALDYIFATGKYSGRQVEATPRLIMLDLKMPKVNGIQVLQIIRADERTKRIPVVILTSSREDPDIKRCYELGANSYVVKPVEIDAFQKAISDLGLYWMLVNQNAE